jgi:group I intron endonuclease
MPKYNNARIYKISNTVDNHIYVGSTTQSLSSRFCGHRVSARKSPKRRIYAHLNNIGWRNAKIVLIEFVNDCKTREDLIAHERRWFDKLKPTLNMETPNRSNKEYRDDHKAQSKKYRDDHKAKMKLYNSEYKKKNDIRSTCECGTEISLSALHIHNKTPRNFKRLRVKAQTRLNEEFIRLSRYELII